MILRVLIYYVLIFLFTMILGGIQQQTNLPSTLILPQWGPGLAGLLMLLLFRKDKHSIKFAFKASQMKNYLAAIILPIILSLGAILVSVFITHSLTFAQVSFIPSLMLAIFTLVGSIGEEIGWRGYLQPTLNKKMNLFWSSVVVSALWIPWHVGNFGYGTLFTIGFFLVILSYSFLISYLIKDTKFNLLIAVLFHWFVNLANSFVPTETLISGQFMLTMGIVAIVIALLVVLGNWKDFKQKA